MGKAVIFSLICILAFVGLQRIFEGLEQALRFRAQRPTVLLYKLTGHADNAELIVRALAADAQRVSTGSGSAVYIVDGGMDRETLELCRRTADQFQNVFIGSFDDAALLLDP